MMSKRPSLTSRKRHSVMLLLAGVILGHVTCRLFPSLVRRGHHWRCTFSFVAERGGGGGGEGRGGGGRGGEGRGGEEGREGGGGRGGGGEGRGEASMSQAKHVVSDKQLLFVGVMTSRKLLRTRARAVRRTWGAGLMNGSLVFFVGSGGGQDAEMKKEMEEEEEEGDLPVHVLHNVKDDDYPPQQKSFAMLEAMHRDYGRGYEWFLRADDDLFVDVRRLRLLLASLHSSRPLYVGHPGLGRTKEVGRLGLSSGVPYCMGGTGVVLSSALLASLGGRLMTCAQKTVTKHEDTELGRCVYNTTRLSCVQNDQISQQFTQSYDDTSGKWIRKALRSSRPYVTFHPVKDAGYMYDAAAQLDLQRVSELRVKVRQLTDSISCMDVYLGNGGSAKVLCNEGNCSLPELCESVIRRDVLFKRFSDVPWFLRHEKFFYTTWIHDIRTPDDRAGLSERFAEVLRHLSAYVRTGTTKKKKHAVLGTFYRRVVPVAGTEYVAFVRDASKKLRPYVIRQLFDELAVVQKQ
ncbi:chondroitin sulfate synthase 1-like isoform X2 [Babylonia areolata]